MTVATQVPFAVLVQLGSTVAIQKSAATHGQPRFMAILRCLASNLKSRRLDCPSKIAPGTSEAGCACFVAECPSPPHPRARPSWLRPRIWARKSEAANSGGGPGHFRFIVGISQAVASQGSLPYSARFTVCRLMEIARTFALLARRKSHEYPGSVRWKGEPNPALFRSILTSQPAISPALRFLVLRSPSSEHGDVVRQGAD